MDKQCICNSGKLFSCCCQPFLYRQKVAKTPVQLMRSRYSAYALGGYGDYLLSTWWPESAHDLNSNELSLRSINWIRLEVLDKSQKGDSATVEFNAFYLDNGHELAHHERSVFQRDNGKWFYVGMEK